MKFFQCQRAGCGVTAEATSNRQRFCPKCKEIERKEKHRAYIAALQKKRNASARANGHLSRDIDRYTIRTRKTVAKILSLSEESIRVIELSAMAKIRRALGNFV